MPWFAMDTDIFSNTKVLSFAEEMRISTDEAVGRLARLWAHALTNADRQGALPRLTAPLLAAILNCSRKTGERTLHTLVSSGLLDALPQGYAVHGWEERQSAWYVRENKRESDRSRMRAIRQYSQQTALIEQAHTSENTTELSHDSRATVVQPVDATSTRTIPYPTRPNRTQPNQTMRNNEGSESCAPDGTPPSPAPQAESIEENARMDEALSLYNEHCPSLPRVLKLTPTRRTALARALGQLGIDGLHNAFRRAEGSPFLTGGNRRQWRASFDWLLSGDHLLRVLEGQYDGGEGAIDDPHATGYRSPDVDRHFRETNSYTPEQFAAMDTDIYELVGRRK